MYTVEIRDYILSCYGRLSASARLIEEQMMKQSIFTGVGNNFLTNCICSEAKVEKSTKFLFSSYVWVIFLIDQRINRHFAHQKVPNY